MLLARGTVLQLDHRIRRRGLAYKRVLPLRPLATFDKEGRATLLELNTGGGLEPGQEAAHKGMLQLAGASGYPERKLCTPLPQLRARVTLAPGCTRAMCMPRRPDVRLR